MHTHQKTLHRIGILMPIGFLLCLVATTMQAFFDELSDLKQELLVWETANAADFSDIIENFDEIAGPMFEDVRESDWFQPYVIAMSDWGIVSGYRNSDGAFTGKFGPANPVTIGEILKMTLEAAQVDESTCGTPTLARANGHWAGAYVACAEKHDMRIMEDRLNLNRPATRAEVLIVLHDAFDDFVLKVKSTYGDTRGHEFESDIAYATSRGIVSGDKDKRGLPTGSFRPDASVNRAEAAKIIYERLKLQVER